MIWLRKFVNRQAKLPWSLSNRKIEKKAERGNNNTYFVVVVNTFLLIFVSLMTFSFFKHINWRGGFDWDELYLVRAASMGDFVTQLIPEPTPPLQAILFKVLLSIGIPPSEMFMRLPNMVIATYLTILLWKITHKYKL
jgi:hypothetical protein